MLNFLFKDNILKDYGCYEVMVSSHFFNSSEITITFRASSCMFPLERLLLYWLRKIHCHSYRGFPIFHQKNPKIDTHHITDSLVDSDTIQPKNQEDQSSTAINDKIREHRINLLGNVMLDAENKFLPITITIINMSLSDN